MRRIVAATAGLLVLGATGALPASARPREGHPVHHGRHKALGRIVAFDGRMLTVARPDGGSRSAAVACDLKVKVAHRGDHDQRGPRSEGVRRGHVTEGTTADLQPGALVLKINLEEGTVEKIIIRPTPAGDADPGLLRARRDGGSSGGHATDEDKHAEDAEDAEEAEETAACADAETADGHDGDLDEDSNGDDAGSDEKDRADSADAPESEDADTKADDRSKDDEDDADLP